MSRFFCAPFPCMNFRECSIASQRQNAYIKSERFNLIWNRSLARFQITPFGPRRMRLSSMADYAVVAMIAAARHCGGSQINASQLAEETGLPAPTVQKLVSRLVAAGLLRSSRGAGGGLRLARPAAAINLADIIEAVEGPMALTTCSDGGKHECSLETACQMRPHWPEVNEALRGALAEVPLSRLVANRDLPNTDRPNTDRQHLPLVAASTELTSELAGASQ